MLDSRRPRSERLYPMGEDNLPRVPEISKVLVRDNIMVIKQLR